MRPQSGSRPWIIVAGTSGALAVALGAFGAHALRPILPLQVMTIFETAVRYHLIHTLALLGCAILIELFPERARLLRISAWAFATGLVLFSGSLYGLSLSGIHLLGAITPLGGVAWIAAWVTLALAFRRTPDAPRPRS